MKDKEKVEYKIGDYVLYFETEYIVREIRYNGNLLIEPVETSIQIVNPKYVEKVEK